MRNSAHALLQGVVVDQALSFAGSPADDYGCLVQYKDGEPAAFNFPGAQLPRG